MLNHVLLGSNDIERSKRFYDAVLGVLGAGEPARNVSPSGHVRLFYRHDGSTFGLTQPIPPRGQADQKGEPVRRSELRTQSVAGSLSWTDRELRQQARSIKPVRG